MEPTTTLETHAELRARMEGEQLEPSHTGYDDARRIHTRCTTARLIARCAGAEDVQPSSTHGPGAYPLPCAEADITSPATPAATAAW
jgi:hypothetical protein